MEYVLPARQGHLVRLSRTGRWDRVRGRRLSRRSILETFSGNVEHPDKGEVIFADPAGRAHARRWTNRQSGYSAVRESTTTILVVTEAMHPAGADDVPNLVSELASALSGTWGLPGAPVTAILTPDSSRFEC